MSYSRDTEDGGKGLSSQQKPEPSSDGRKSMKRVPQPRPPQQQITEETIQESNKKQASVLTAEIPDSAVDKGLANAGTSTEQETAIAARQHQVIAVSASKGATVFFNLARKFLMQDEMCDLSALEAAINVAVDTASLLQRSQLATIIRVKTSYVIAEPKHQKKRPAQQLEEQSITNEEKVAAVTTNLKIQSSSSLPSSSITDHDASSAAPAPATTTDRNEPLLRTNKEKVTPAGRKLPLQPKRLPAHDGRTIRRAQLIITVQRTEAYKRWLEENPITAVAAAAVNTKTAEGSDDDDVAINILDEQNIPIGGGRRHHHKQK